VISSTLRNIVRREHQHIEGTGLERCLNDFVIVGPKNGPACIKGGHDAVAAFKGIAAAKAPFISRGDNSGTNALELRLWKTTGIEPKEGTQVSDVTAMANDCGVAGSALAPTALSCLLLHSRHSLRSHPGMSGSSFLVTCFRERRGHHEQSKRYLSSTYVGDGCCDRRPRDVRWRWSCPVVNAD
jgi:hypothetical protein